MLVCHVSDTFAVSHSPLAIGCHKLFEPKVGNSQGMQLRFGETFNAAGFTSSGSRCQRFAVASLLVFATLDEDSQHKSRE